MASRRTKRTLILMLATAAVVFITMAGLALRNMGRLQEKWIGELANDLITTTNSPRLLFLGSEVKIQLTELLAAPAGLATIEHGDAPEPIGDGRAMHYLILTNKAGKQLGLRLRPAESNTLEIVGSWIPE